MVIDHTITKIKYDVIIYSMSHNISHLVWNKFMDNLILYNLIRTFNNNIGEL